MLEGRPERGERDEADLEALLEEAGTLTRTNVVAMVSPNAIGESYLRPVDY